MLSFLHRTIISRTQYIIRSNRYSFCIAQNAFLILNVTSAAVLHVMNHKGIQFQLQIFFTLLLKKKKKPYILIGLRVSKLTANFHFRMNYPFNVAVDKQLRYSDRYRGCGFTKQNQCRTKLVFQALQELYWSIKCWLKSSQHWYQNLC